MTATDPNITTTADPEHLARATGHGATWVMLGMVVSKIAAMVAQVILGWLLTDTDFGVFATAGAIGGFLNLLKDGGTLAILLQKGEKEYERVSGPLFWMSMVFSCGSALLLVAMSYPLAFVFPKTPEPEIMWILMVIALATPINAVAFQLQTKLRQDLRFADYTRITTVSAILRQVSTIAFALMGLGPMCFAWPYVVCAAYEAWASYRATVEPVWKRGAERHLWGGFLRQSVWAIGGSATNLMLDQGTYLVLGIVLPLILAQSAAKAISGQFYFAFQLTAQMGVLIGYGVQQVLLPVLARLNDDPHRQAGAILRALRAMMLSGSISCIALSVLIDPFEDIVWRGRWHAVVPAIVVLGMAFPWRISFGITTAVLHAQGRFKRHALATGFEGVLLLLVSLIACFTTPTAMGISWWVAGSLIVGRLVVTANVLSGLGFKPVQIFSSTVPAWLLACFAGALTLAFDRAVDIHQAVQGIAEGLITRLLPTIKPHTQTLLSHTAGQAGRLVVLALVVGCLFALFIRLFLAEHLRDLLRVAPARIRSPVARLLFLPAKPAELAEVPAE